MRWLCALAVCCLGCSVDLEIKGNTERVIGETVTVELVEGTPILSGAVTLHTADRNQQISASELEITGIDERTLSFVIPPGAAAGSATVELGKGGEDGAYSFAMSISRLALGMQSNGSVEVLPLRPSPLASQILGHPNTSGTSRQLAISPRGALLATLVGDELGFHLLGRSVQPVAPIVAVEGQLAALPSGAVVVTPTSLRQYTYVPGQGVQEGASFSLSGGEVARAVATSRDGGWALVLTSCSTAPQGDCVVQIDLRGATPARGAEARLDDTQSATSLTAGADGSTAIVLDGPTIYGVGFSGTSPPRITTVTWDGAQTNGVARGVASLEKIASDYFAVSALGLNAVRMFGFKDGYLRDVMVPQVELGFSPDYIAFGRGADLYIVNGQTLYLINATSPGQPSQLLAAPSAPLQRFAVQP